MIVIASASYTHDEDERLLTKTTKIQVAISPRLRNLIVYLTSISGLCCMLVFTVHPTSGDHRVWGPNGVRPSKSVGEEQAYQRPSSSFHHRMMAEVDANGSPDLNTQVLPEKLYTVVGLESSGTTFTARTLGWAMSLYGQEEYDETVAYGNSTRFTDNRSRSVEVQHLSLPYGGECSALASNLSTTVVNVVYPKDCVSVWREQHWRLQYLSKEVVDECVRIMGNDTQFRTDRNPSTYNDSRTHQASYSGSLPLPPRWFVNITSHLQWYRSRGVDARVIIVFRDATLSRRSRDKHCSYGHVKQVEEDLGMSLMLEAIDHYLPKATPQPAQPPPDLENSGGGVDANSRVLRERHTQISRHLALHNGILQADDQAITIVSYELLMRLQNVYLQSLFSSLGIASDYAPEFIDGNAKHAMG
jgi:hypothetical protein